MRPGRHEEGFLDLIFGLLEEDGHLISLIYTLSRLSEESDQPVRTYQTSALIAWQRIASIAVKLGAPASHAGSEICAIYRGSRSLSDQNSHGSFVRSQSKEITSCGAELRADNLQDLVLAKAACSGTLIRQTVWYTSIVRALVDKRVPCGCVRD